MALRVFVCHVDAVPPGESRAFAVAGVTVPVLVTNVDGVLHATTSLCPHEDVSLEGGDLEGTTIACPGHGYLFDLRTGQCDHDPSLRLRRYPVTVVDDRMYVDLV